MTYVYESPDGGDTVYRREMGKTDRALHHVSSKKKDLEKSHNRYLMWEKILVASKTNSALNEAVERAEVLYNLIQHND
jgi:predicted translin family RNA/ssDNA-binding protein